MHPAHVADVHQVANAGASRYVITAALTLNNSGNYPASIQGQVRVDYTNTEPNVLNEIHFRLYPNLPQFGGTMTVTQALINNQPVDPVLAVEDSVLRLPLAAPLPVSETITIHLDYAVDIPDAVPIGYNIFSLSDDTLALAGFYPVIAVYDARGWENAIPPPHSDATYLDTALYEVTLTVPATMTVAASGTMIQHTRTDITQTLTYVTGPMRDFYVAMRSDYAVISDTVDGIVVNSYYLPGQDEGGTQALQYSLDSLRLFNEWFGPYPYNELDVVATPTRAGGIEYPGIIVIAQGLYRGGDFFQHATVHEVAHQWWYGVVGNDQIHEPWLDEALTNYTTWIYWEATATPAKAQQIFQGYFQAPYENAQAAGTDGPVIAPAADFSVQLYGTLVYGKGPLFFHALRQEEGDATYFDIMQRYYNTYKYRHATGNDLFNIIEAVSGRSVAPLVETWLTN